jgi:exonuclease SbcC
MIPIQLTLEGLYSYQERQIIDFKNLTEAGIFGIFGSVGSGKSSILEAISFVLYGETERLNSRDKRSYNMMNLKLNRSYIEFDFLNFENKKFRATREFKRNSKNFEDIKSATVVFYEWKNDSWIPLENSKTEDIIGLSYANFKRTIIIPQGQFKEFLELGATERTTMMKEIFNLQKFDLQNNVSALNFKNKSELDQLEGQLKGFEEVSEGNIIAQKEILKLEQKKFNEINVEFKKIEENYLQLKNVKTDFLLINQKNEDYKKLVLKKPEIDDLETKTERFEKAFRIFNPLIIEKNKLQTEIKNQQKEKDFQIDILKESEINFKNITEKIVEILPKFENLNQSKTEENDLKLILQMLQFSEEIKTLKERTENGSKKVEEVEEKLKLIRDKIKEFSEKLELLKPKKLDSDLLLKIGNWFSTKKNLIEIEKNQLEKKNQLKIKISEIANQFSENGVNIETFKIDFENKLEILENQKQEITAKQNHFLVQEKLAHFANELHDGEPCLLCGSTEHPNIVGFDDVNSELEDLKNQLKKLENQEKELKSKSLETEKILERKKLLGDQLETENDQFLALKIQIENHEKEFVWNNFDPKNETYFNTTRQESFSIEKQLEEIQKSISSEQKNSEKEQKSLDQYKEALEKFNLEEAKKEEQINTNKSNLKVLIWNNFEKKRIQEIEILHQQLLKSNFETEENYQRLIQKEKELSPKLSAQKALADQLKKRISDLEKEIFDNEKNIKNALAENQFSEFSQIENILAEKINTEESRFQIQKFRIGYETLKNGIAELEAKLKGFVFDEEQFSVVENQFEAIEKDKEIANKNVIKITSEIERLQVEFKKKEDLLKDLSLLQRRAENLKIITNLFKGAGFVQYVSSIYLRQLCDHANIRFHRMTRNQLSLQLNENNDFEIIDYLNEGRSRSVKTLSGGQSFQVSLSLALALAESVQANAKAEKNFFFIDEGFGTQDLDSVNVVFETLLSLQKENRIVGIISHVEELKEKIPVSLNIVKDEERGSLIEVL